MSCILNAVKIKIYFSRHLVKVTLVNEWTGPHLSTFPLIENYRLLYGRLAAVVGWY